MTPLKTLTLAAALMMSATSLAMAQNGGANGNNGMPPKEYLGPGAYQGYDASQFRQPGNSSNTMPPKQYLGPGAYQSYDAAQFGGNPAGNAARSGGSGTHVTSQRTGSAANSQKVFGNQNGYRRVYAYQPSPRCRRLMAEGRPLPISCR
jgi:hypothetical protein